MNRPTRLYRTQQIRALEALAFQREPSYAVMTRAGHAAARWLDARAPAGGTLLFIAGRGNNGGDALVAATHLHRQGRAVHVWLLASPDALPVDARQAWEDAQAVRVPMHIVPLPADDAVLPSIAAGLPPFPTRMSAIVDGLLGIGLTRPVQGALAAVIAHLNAAPVPRFALDVPSGLNADTGIAPSAIRAKATITFIGAKPGLYTADGRDIAGHVTIDALDIRDDTVTADAMLNDPYGFTHAFPARRHASHKGSYGSVAIIGGDTGMCGAPLLAARAALRLGAGRVHVGLLADTPPLLDPIHPELMLRTADQLDAAAMNAVVLGPGMGQGVQARRWIDALPSNDGKAYVLDADALNLLAQRSGIVKLGSHVVLTPHPLEAARLLGASVQEIQADRLTAAAALSQRFQAVVVLKGSGTVIASPDHGVVINPTGNAALATAGTGDVLAGMMGALLAQGMPTYEATLAAVWLHGHAADQLVADGAGIAGFAAGDLAAHARIAYNGLMQSTPNL